MSSKHKQTGKATLGGKLVLAALIAVVLGGGLFYVQRLRPAGLAASVAQVQGVVETNTVARAKAPAIVPTNVTVAGCRVTILTIPWNAVMGLMFANGDVQTAPKSLMERYGVHAVLMRQDDYGKMQEAQLKFAQDLKGGNNCPTAGAAFVVIMGDGYSAYAGGIAPEIAKLNQHVEVVGGLGKSHGEDACMLPYEVANDPQKARGSLIGLVLRDGDYNICVAWASVNQIPINPDDKTYDPDAINFISTDSFAQADEGYIAGKCEDRPVVKNGKHTGEIKHVCQNGTATWTPGDVNVATHKGGLAKVASSADFGNQMAATLIGNKEFDAAHPEIVKGILKASFAGADQIEPSTGVISSDALLAAGAVSAKVYKEQTAQYWAKYFPGVVEKDAQGVPVRLGGSKVMDAADNANYFGLSPGSDDIYHQVYDMFGKHYVKYYPSVLSSYPKYEDVVNLSYVRSIVNDTGVTADMSNDKVVYTANQKVDRVVSRGNFNVEFDTGQATLRPEAYAGLDDLLSQLISTTLAVELRGHTDNTGNAQNNIVLSQARANAVRAYLMSKAPGNFNVNRVTTKGMGQLVPIADNSTVEGRAKNRRVEVILGSVGN